MAYPTLAEVKAYLGDDLSWTDAEVQQAMDAELEAQWRVCKFTLAPPADLVEAFLRRVQHNLTLRGLPLGFQTSMSEAAVATTRVGGTDAEVRRLEAPHRKLVLG